MAKSEYKFDEIILDKRSSDAAQPASGKFALYNKNGGAYIRDGDSGSIAPLSSTAQSHVYLGTQSITAGTAQWDIALPTGYIELELHLRLQTNSTTSRNLRIRFDNVSATASYRSQYLRHSAGTAGGTGITTSTHLTMAGIISRNNAVPSHNWVSLSVFDYQSTTLSTTVHVDGQNTLDAVALTGSGAQNTGFVSATSVINLFPDIDAFGNCEMHMWGKKAT